MIKRILISVLLITLIPFALPAEERRTLNGKVVSVGENGELNLEPDISVTIQETSQSDVTNSLGVFRIFLPAIFKSGEKVTLIIDKPGWRIQYPLDGEARIPADLKKELIEVRLLPKGSKLFLSHDRIEKLVRDLSEKSRQQVTPEGKPEDVDFNRYIREWAVQYGFNAREAEEEISKWISEVEEKENDLYKLGLAAFAKKNFKKAGELFAESAEIKVKRLEETRHKKNIIEEKEKILIEEVVRDFQLEGDSHYNNYYFSNALNAYQKAMKYVSQEQSPLLWASTYIYIGNAYWQQGIRAKGSAIHEHLNAAVNAYKRSLEVYTREQLPQQWAMTQNNMGNALSDQGIRTGGEDGAKLLAEAVSAYRSALEVRTREQLPQPWATTQNNMGAALQEQGIRTGGEEGARLLGEAVSAYRSALEVYTREQLPQEWATTQNNLGNALSEQGIRTGGEEGARLLGEAVNAYRSALEVRTREQLPQDWAMTQNNLGTALKNQGIRTGGEDGAKLLAEAVSAYRSALEVYTREQLPQEWATTQNNLGNALSEQGIRTGGEDGAKLLTEAVSAYRNALEVRTMESLPPQWAQTQNNLAKAFFYLEEWQNSAESYANVLKVYPDYKKAYFISSSIYQDMLFKFQEAFNLNKDWLELHPEDVSALVDFAEKHFTTGRFEECDKRIKLLLENADVDSAYRIVLMTLEIANLLAMNSAEHIPARINSIIEIIASQTEDFKVTNSFDGTKYFINKNEKLAVYREWLLQFFSAINEENSSAIISALEEAQESFKDLENKNLN